MSRSIYATLGAFVWLLVALASAPAAPAAQQSVGGVITGRVVDDTGAPLAGAAVTVAEPVARSSASATTDAEGRFAFGDLEPGRYELSAMHDRHAGRTYGAPPQGGTGIRHPGTPIRVDEGQTVTDLVVELPRFGAIRGTTYDYTGTPADTRVTVYAADRTWGSLEMFRAGFGQSSPSGRYYIGDLPPGTYVVQAAPREVVPFPVRPEDDSAPWQVAVATYYGGAHDPVSATEVTVLAGLPTNGIDIYGDVESTAAVLLAPRANGRTMSRVIKSVSRPDWPDFVSGVVASNGQPAAFTEGDGTERRPMRLIAGRYRISASADVDGEPWWWSGIVTSDGETPLALEPSLTPPASIVGRLEFDGADDLPGQIRIRAWPADNETALSWMAGRVQGGRATGLVENGGRFELSGLPPGRYVLRLILDSSERTLVPTSLTINGRDALDLPFPVVSGPNTRDVAIGLADEQASLRGLVLGEDDTPHTDVSLVVFPVDSRYWWGGSRRIQAVRPDTSGAFEVRGLPSGAYQLAVVRERLPALLGDSNALLTELSSAATLVAVSDGEAVEPVVIRVR